MNVTVDSETARVSTVTDRFALKTKYFYDEENLDAFREAYSEMGPLKKATENPTVAGGGLLVMLMLVGVTLFLLGGGLASQPALGRRRWRQSSLHRGDVGRSKRAVGQRLTGRQTAVS